MGQFQNMRLLKWILTSLPTVLLATPAVAAIPTLTPATSFYRSPDAVFVSGQASRNLLEKRRIRSEFTLLQRIKWDGKDYAVTTDDLIRDAQCFSKGVLHENSALLADLKSDAPAVAGLAKNDDVEILETRQHWARVRTAAGREGWMPLFRLEGRNDDPGVFVALIDTTLREKPAINAVSRAKIPARERLKALAFEDGWIKVSHRGTTGFVDAHHVVGRADFAAWAWTRKTKTWVLVSHREGTNLRTRDGGVLPMNEVSGYATNARKAVVSQMNDPRLPPLRAHADVVKVEATRWGISKLDDHGEVWWRQDSRVMEDLAGPNAGITTEDLLKRDIFSYSLAGTKKIDGLVSARGIWKTDDGVLWKKIDAFGDTDYPVAVHPDGYWFIGTYRSKDRGANFESFIHWETLTKTIETALSRPARYLKLQKIEALPSSRLQIVVDTGVKRLSLTTHLLGNTWQASR